MKMMLYTKKQVQNLITHHLTQNKDKPDKYNTRCTWENMPGLLEIPDVQLAPLQQQATGSGGIWLDFVRKRAIVLAKRAIVDSVMRLWIVVARLWVGFSKSGNSLSPFLPASLSLSLCLCLSLSLSHTHSNFIFSYKDKSSTKGGGPFQAGRAWQLWPETKKATQRTLWNGGPDLLGVGAQEQGRKGWCRRLSPLEWKVLHGSSEYK